MSKSLNPTHIDEAVELAERQAGSTTRTLVPIPEQVSNSWGLKYGEYVRVSIIATDDGPKLAIAPMGNMKYRQRNNELKLSSGDEVALPRRIVRAFGLAGDVWWQEFENQLVGDLTEYSDEGTLFEVVNYYTSVRLPGTDERRTTFADLRTVADQQYQYTEADPHGITTYRGAIRHTVPEGMELDDGDERVFVIFHDGDEFIIGLIPLEENEDDGTPFFNYQYNPMSASPGSHLENLPSVLLDYDKDRVTFHRDTDDRIYYTVPKQVASCLWLDDGFITDWLKVGDAYLAKLVPESRDRTRKRADPTVVPR